jgi:Tfp pilus assembly protein PilN
MSSPNDLSFLPDDYMERKAQRRAAIIGGSLLSVVVLGVAGALYVTERSTDGIERHHAQVVHEFNEAARRLEQVKKMHDQQRKIVQHAELAASLVEKVPRSNILAELTNSLPPGTSLLDFLLESHQHQDPTPVASTAFDQKKAALEAKQKADAAGVAADAPKFDVHIRLSGLADTDVQVAQFLSRLSASPLFRDVNMVVSEIYHSPTDHGNNGKNDTLRRFQIEMMLNPNADVPDGPRATRTAAVELSK